MTVARVIPGAGMTESQALSALRVNRLIEARKALQLKRTIAGMASELEAAEQRLRDIERGIEILEDRDW